MESTPGTSPVAEAAEHHVAELKVLDKISKSGPAKSPSLSMLDERRPARITVFVTHGMGQQAPFETRDLVAQGLITASGGITSRTVEARTVHSDAIDLQRLEFGISDKSGNDAEIHVYEAYWAPLTEGQVNLKDVMRGVELGYCISGSETWRMLFNSK